MMITTPAQLQLNPQQPKVMKHLLTIEGLNKQLVTDILDTAESFFDDAKHSYTKKPLLQGHTVVNLFFEDSTRTRTTFEIAAKNLSAEVINFHTKTSSVQKGESLLDTFYTFQAMGCKLLVVRHSDPDVLFEMAQHSNEDVSIINAGDGTHAHPTQALLDMLTIRQHKPDFENLSVAIVGDILHSRVARSDIEALKLLGVKDIRLVAPKLLLPDDINHDDLAIHHKLEQGIKDVDVIITLRLQHERMNSLLKPNGESYSYDYCLTEARLKAAKPDAIVMHPGPINRGVEISSAVVDGAQSVVLQQVHNGIAIRMAVLSMLNKG